MAGGMPLRNVSKGPVFRKADAAYSNAVNRADDLLQYAQASNKEAAFVNLARARGIFSDAEHDRVAQNWFGNVPPSWWPAYDMKISILAEGFRKAFELSLDLQFQPGRHATSVEISAKRAEINGNVNYGKPVVSVWLCAGHHFQCVVMDSPKQVTLMLLTPSVPSNVVPDRPMTQHQGLWLVSNKAEADALRMAATYPGGPHTSPESEEQIVGVMVTPIYGEEDGAFDRDQPTS